MAASERARSRRTRYKRRRAGGGPPRGMKAVEEKDGVTEALGKDNYVSSHNTRLPNPTGGNFSVSGSFCTSVPRTPPPRKEKRNNHKRPTGVSLPGPVEEDKEVLQATRLTSPAPDRWRRPLHSSRCPEVHFSPRKPRPPGERERRPGTPSRRHAPAGTHAAQVVARPQSLFSPGPEAAAFPPDANARYGGRCQSRSQSEGSGLQASC